MNNKITKGMGVLLMLPLLLAGLAGCSPENNQANSAQVQTGQKPVGVIHVQPQTMEITSELSGTLEPIEETVVSFEVGGEIQSLAFQEGDPVKAGEVVAKLNAKDYALQVQMASTSVSQAGASLSKVKNGAREQEKTQAKLAVDAKQISLDQARDDFRRMEQLYTNEAISQLEYENAKNALNLAQKDYDNAKQAYSLVVEGARSEDVALTQASYQSAVVSQNQATHVLSKTQLTSPITGTVLSKLADVGQLANAGTPVYRIGNIHQLKTILPVPDKDITTWKTGDSVSVALYGKQRTGKVSKIYPATNQQTGTIGVEVVIDNQAQDWYAGQVISAKRTLSQAAGLYVPAEAVMSRGADPFVFVIKDDKALKTPVSLGKFMNGHFEITAGLQTGDVLIVNGGDRLLDGDTVTVEGGKEE